ncbi:MAG: enoyl-CoA hydratase/isomerase family protein [Oligoflexia bacterium]|nr:enoyl-CoA hydratase/isomerase family protein [Oligoflexia bacterium]
MALVIFESVNSHTARITLNDPTNLNAMGEAMADEFSALVEKLSQSTTKPRAIVITGAGRAFSAGGNLDMLEKKIELSPEENKRRMLKFYYSFLGIFKLNVPLIAAVNGHAIGAGLCVACACDVRLAAEGAKFGVTFTKLGLHPGMGGTCFIPRVVGHAVAAELMLSGRVIEASEAHKLGLVSQVLSPSDLLREAQKVADDIAACGPQATQQLVESLRVGQAELEEYLQREASCQSENYRSPEFKEGVRAAIEKRSANFKS